jgi:hypothetical protein
MTAPASRPDPVVPLVQRLVAASGIFFAILVIVTIALTSAETPDEADPVVEWTAYARDNEDNLRIGALVFALAAYSFLLFLGVLRDAVGRAEQAARGFTRAAHIVLAAGIAGIVGLTIAIGLSASGLSNPDTPPEILRAVSDVSGGAWLIGSAGMSACFVTTGLINQTARALPPWLGWVAIGAGLAWMLQLGVLLSEEEDNAFGIFFPIGFLLLVVFCAGASSTFLRDVGRDRMLPPA